MSDSVNPRPEVELRDVDIVFGDDHAAALRLLDEGLSREAIIEECGSCVGVCDASLTVGKGEICVLMGLSGSGKSTLLRAVNGLIRVARGQVLLSDGDDQIDIAAITPAELRVLRMTRISMVFQQFALLPWRTVEQNVGFGLELRGLSAAERTDTVREKLEMVGLARWRDKYAHELSGGMQQRVGLARAFATDADILLMDEPFSALDPLIRNRLQDELLALQARLDKTVLFVSHDLDEAIKLGSRIAIMESGRIVQFGSPEDIVLNPVNEYVSDFIAHMNPVGVLRASSIMTRIETLPTTDGQVALGDSGVRLQLGNGRLESATRDGKTVAIATLDASDEPQPHRIHVVPTDIPMRQAIEIRYASQQPVLLQDGGTVVGVIGDDEIYRAILHRQRESSGAHQLP